jgi:electron transport complex protein RnfG
MTHVHGAPTPPAPAPDVSPWRLMGTLAGAGGIAGLLIVVSFGLTQPTIERNKAERLAAAVEEVLKAPDHYDTLFVVNGALTPDAPAGANPTRIEQVYVGYRADGTRIGFAVAAAEPGFQDVIRLIFGYDPESRELLGMKVLESKETPGLGDKIEKDTAFVGQFDGVGTPLVGVKAGRASGDAAEVDLITGATISSRTVVRIINNALTRLTPMLEQYDAAAGSEAP